MKSLIDALNNIVEAIVSPTKCFQQHKERQVNPLILFAILFVIGLILTYLITPFTLKSLSEHFAKYSEQYSPEQREQFARMFDPNTFRIRMLLTFAIVFVFKTLLRGLVFTVAAPIVDAELTFGDAVSSSLYADVIVTFGSLIQLILLWITGAHSMTFSPAVFLPPEQLTTFWGKVLGSLNIFSIWSFYVLGVGIAVLGKTSKSKGIILSYAVWILWILGMSSIGYHGSKTA